MISVPSASTRADQSHGFQKRYNSLGISDRKAPADRPGLFAGIYSAPDQSLFKKAHCAAEHTDVVVAGDVLIQAAADSLGMTHFSENAAVRRGDAFHSQNRAVGIEMYIVSGPAVKIHLLCGNLAVGGKLTDKLFAGEEAPFTV